MRSLPILLAAQGSGLLPLKLKWAIAHKHGKAFYLQAPEVQAVCVKWKSAGSTPSAGKLERTHICKKVELQTLLGSTSTTYTCPVECGYKAYQNPKIRNCCKGNCPAGREWQAYTDVCTLDPTSTDLAQCSAVVGCKQSVYLNPTIEGYAKECSGRRWVSTS